MFSSLRRNGDGSQAAARKQATASTESLKRTQELDKVLFGGSGRGRHPVGTVREHKLSVQRFATDSMHEISLSTSSILRASACQMPAHPARCALLFYSSLSGGWWLCTLQAGQGGDGSDGMVGLRSMQTATALAELCRTILLLPLEMHKPALPAASVATHTHLMRGEARPHSVCGGESSEHSE